ncbi:MAG: hypothetical protein IPN76_31320 [Saprospiraceae bacterium]|nr:hypothetical protein [Saprospiraceae bacterium]
MEKTGKIIPGTLYYNTRGDAGLQKAVVCRCPKTPAFWQELSSLSPVRVATRRLVSPAKNSSHGYDFSASRARLDEKPATTPSNPQRNLKPAERGQAIIESVTRWAFLPLLPGGRTAYLYFGARCKGNLPQKGISHRQSGCLYG